MKEYNHIQHEVLCAGVTRAQTGFEVNTGELAWRIHLHFHRYLWPGSKFTQCIFIGNEYGWFAIGEEERSALDRELIQLLEHIAAQEDLQLIP